MRLDETEADGAIGLHGAELRSEQEIAHEGEDAVVRAGRLSEEIRNEREFGFDPNNPPTDPTPMPQLRCLSSQFEIDGQPVSPPKL